jgi:hypothetical protein
VASHLTYLRFNIRRRQALAWEMLASNLSPKMQRNLPGQELGQQSNRTEEWNATPEEQWRSINGAHGLWAMYEDARVMLDMANYAARNSDTVDKELLASLRSDAVQIRISVLLALSKYACSQVNESTCANVARAAATYAAMMDHMAQLLQANNGALVTGLASTM